MADEPPVLLDELPGVDFKKGDRVIYSTRTRTLRGTVEGLFISKLQNTRDDRWVQVHFEWQDIGSAQFNPHELRKLDLIERIGELA